VEQVEEEHQEATGKPLNAGAPEKWLLNWIWCVDVGDTLKYIAFSAFFVVALCNRADHYIFAL